MIPFDINAISTTVNSLENLLKKVKDKLLNNPEEASAKLAEVLDELCGLLDFIESETVHFLGIVFLDDGSNFISCRSALLSLESGYVKIRGYEARGHCHKIGNIYNKYLAMWFNKVLDPAEVNEFKTIFDTMNTADYDMISGIESLAQYLKTESGKILDLIDDKRTEEANALIKSARKDLLQTRREMVDALANLRLLQAGFIATSRAV